ncbi:MAG: hypothetical protein JWM28_2234 [Chitinophagaceae bacterium]|nr:hypothetical protein [Chitinophagaceae bacterium]
MKKIAPDKWKHFYVGIPSGAVIYGLAILNWPQQKPIAIAVSFLILVAVCYGFELFSLLTGKGHYEVNDALAGILGGTIGIFVVLFFLKLTFPQ